MAKKALSSLKYVVVLALVISSFQILCTKGRHIKSLDKQEVSNKKEEMPMSPAEATSSIGFHDSAVANNDNYFQPMHTGSSPGIGHQLVDDSTDDDHEGDIPKSLGATSCLEHSVTASTKDFQPTQTGSSPGIGLPKSLGATSGLEHSVTPSTKDFQPTEPEVSHASKRKN